jgi:uncharacterized protein YfiM (DUF2279 family)
MKHIEVGIRRMNDKVQHFIAGLCLSLTGVFFFPLIITGFIFGIGKELYDYVTGRGVVEWKDMYATFYGAILGSVIVWIVLTL